MLASTLVTGGAERVFESLATGLPGFGYDPLVLCLHSPGRTGERMMEAGAAVETGIMRGRHDPLAVTRLARIFRREGGGILLSLDHHDAIVAGISAAVLAGLGGRVLSVHSTGLWKKGSSFTRLDRLFLAASFSVRLQAGIIFCIATWYEQMTLGDPRRHKKRASPCGKPRKNVSGLLVSSQQTWKRGIIRPPLFRR